MHDNDVHINHFSIEGLATMGKSVGARVADFFVSQDVYHKSPGAYPGMLFRSRRSIETSQRVASGGKSQARITAARSGPSSR